MWVWGVHFAPCRLARMLATWWGSDYLMGLEAVMHASCTQHIVRYTNIDECSVVHCNASSLDVDIRCQRGSLPQNGKAQMISSFRTVLFLIFYIQISCETYTPPSRASPNSGNSQGLLALDGASESCIRIGCDPVYNFPAMTEWELPIIVCHAART